MTKKQGSGNWRRVFGIPRAVAEYTAGSIFIVTHLVWLGVRLRTRDMG
jgi:hypothetical protein